VRVEARGEAPDVDAAAGARVWAVWHWQWQAGVLVLAGRGGNNHDGAEEKHEEEEEARRHYRSIPSRYGVDGLDRGVGTNAWPAGRHAMAIVAQVA
jgi:hypothetical protein